MLPLELECKGDGGRSGFTPNNRPEAVGVFAEEDINGESNGFSLISILGTTTVDGVVRLRDTDLVRCAV